MYPYAGIEKCYKKTSEVATKLGILGHMPFSYITDRTRHISFNHGWVTKDDYIEYELENRLGQYQRNLLQTQHKHFYIMVEKETVANLVDPIAENTGYPLPT